RPRAGTRPSWFRPRAQSSHSASCYRWEHFQAIAGLHRRRLVSALAIDEHVDVPADLAALVEDPPRHRRILQLQRRKQLEDRPTLELMLGASAREAAQRSPHANHGHGTHPRHAHEPTDRDRARFSSAFVISDGGAQTHGRPNMALIKSGELGDGNLKG